MSSGRGMLSRRTDAPPSGGTLRVVRWANRAHMRPCAWMKLTASRLPGSHSWTTAPTPSASTASIAASVASRVVVHTAFNRCPAPPSSAHERVGFTTAGSPTSASASSACAASLTSTPRGTRIPSALARSSVRALSTATASACSGASASPTTRSMSARRRRSASMEPSWKGMSACGRWLAHSSMSPSTNASGCCAKAGTIASAAHQREANAGAPASHSTAHTRNLALPSSRSATNA